MGMLATVESPGRWSHSDAMAFQGKEAEKLYHVIARVPLVVVSLWGSLNVKSTTPELSSKI